MDIDLLKKPVVALKQTTALFSDELSHANEEIAFLKKVGVTQEESISRTLSQALKSVDALKTADVVHGENVAGMKQSMSQTYDEFASMVTKVTSLGDEVALLREDVLSVRDETAYLKKARASHDETVVAVTSKVIAQNDQAASLCAQFSKHQTCMSEAFWASRERNKNVR